MKVGVARLLRHRGLEVGRCARRLAALEAGARQEQPGLEVARVEAQGVVELARRVGCAAGFEQRGGQAIAAVGEAGLFIDRMTQGCERIARILRTGSLAGRALRVPALLRARARPWGPLPARA